MSYYVDKKLKKKIMKLQQNPPKPDELEQRVIERIAELEKKNVDIELLDKVCLESGVLV